MANLTNPHSWPNAFGLPGMDQSRSDTGLPVAASSWLLPRADLACSIGLLALGLGVLLGWLTGARLFDELQAENEPMVPSTACLLVLLSWRLILRQRRPFALSTHRFGVLAAGIAILLSMPVLVLPACGLDTSLAGSHLPSSPIPGNVPIGRMAPLPAALVAEAHEGWVEAVDDRHIPVVAVTRRVPGRPWHILAKVDLAASLLPVRERAWTTGVTLCLLTLIAVLSAGLRQRQRDRFWLKKQHAIERDGAERYRALFVSSQNALMTLAPPSWRFASANPATVRMFEAKDEEEFVSFEPWVASPEMQPDGRRSSEKAREMIEIALREGSHYFEWTHKRLGGESFPATVLLTRLELNG